MSNARGDAVRTSLNKILRALALAAVAAVLCAALVGCGTEEGRAWGAQAGNQGAPSSTSTLAATRTPAASNNDSVTPCVSWESSQAASVGSTQPPRPAQPSFDATAYLGRTIESVKTDRREVALTFDDGPSANTEKVLAILKADNAKATFFFVGERSLGRQQPLVRDAVAQGHEVGNHTWSHTRMKRVGPGTLGYEIDRAQSVLTSATGTAPLFMRPRSGKIDAKARTAVQSRGLILVLWSIHPSDVQPSPSPKEIVRRATRGVRAGSIVLLHETNDNTVLALPGILAELRRRGLQPVTLSQLMSRSKP